MEQIKKILASYKIVLDERYLIYLNNLGYTCMENIDDDPIENYQTPRRIVLAERYHGMGHNQWICFDPTRKTDDKFYIAVVGGGNDYDRKYNFKNFKGLCVRNEPVFLNPKNLMKMVTITLHQIWFNANDVDKMNDQALEDEMNDQALEDEIL